MFLTNVLILMLFIGIAFKIVTENFMNGNTLARFKLMFKILKATIFYIPCLITELVEYLTNSTKDTKRLVYIVLLIQIVLLFMNTILPIIDSWISKHLGSVILDKPLYLNNNNNFGDYKIEDPEEEGAKGSIILNSSKELRYKAQKEDYGLYNEGRPTKDLKYKDLNIIGHLDIFNLFGGKDEGIQDHQFITKDDGRSFYDHN